MEIGTGINQCFAVAVGLKNTFQGFFMSAARVEPESEPEFESADEGLGDLGDRLAELQLAPRPPTPEAVQPVRHPATADLENFPFRLVAARAPGGVEVERVSDREITIRGLVGGVRILNLEPLRFYTVWLVPGYTGPWNFSGVHAGAGTRGYEALLRLNGGYERLRFRRANSLEDARRLFLEEADRHGVNRNRVDFRFNWL